MSAPVDVLAVMGRAAGLLDLTAPSHEPEAAAELLAAGAAVAELVEAAREYFFALDNGQEEFFHEKRLRAALAKFGGAA